MKRLIIFLVAANMSISGFTQNLDFYSETMELIVKYQLGLSENIPLTKEIADTITILDLSGYGLTDIRDLSYFPKLVNLDLSYNQIEDISPLVGLEYLTDLDLSNNRLKNLNDLAFSESYEMTVVTSSNYITEYSFLFNNPNCFFTIIGLNYQKSPYRVNRFYSDFDPNTSQKIVNYNVWTYNEYDSIYLMVDGKKELITEMDEDISIRKSVSGNMAYLNAESSNIDSVFFVLPQTMEINEIVTEIIPSLPADYSILSAEALKSNVSFSDQSIVYVMTSDIADDTIRIGYGLNEYDIKGYTYYYLKNDSPTDIEHLPVSEKLLFYPNPVDNTLTVVLPNAITEEATIYLVNLTGQIVYQAVTNQTTCQINVQNLEKGIYILFVKAGNESFTEKIIKR